MFLAMTGTVKIAGQPLVVEGGLTADLHAAARITRGAAADGSIAVTVTGATATVGALPRAPPANNGQELNGLITLGGNDLRALIEGLLDGLIPTFTDQLLPPLL